MGRDPERPSWFDAFAPDDGLVGICGVLTSLSADQPFLEGVLRSFTGRGPGARRGDGRVVLTLLADRHQGEFEPVPGLYHAHAAPAAWAGGQLQHAKVALLAFGPAAHGLPTAIRLLVSTGNWTMSTASGSIDLLWRCDLSHRVRGEDPQEEEAVDVAAALDFLDRLLLRYLLPTPVSDSLTSLSRQMRDLVGSHRPGARRRSRFISTLGTGSPSATSPTGWPTDSIGAQVIDRFQTGATRRTLLVCGSGFFEQESQAGEPVVLRDLVAALQEAGSLAASLGDDSKWLVANPGTSGAVASWVRADGDLESGWMLRRPRHPTTGAADTFHAKFVLLANRRERVTGGQLYLGSGNLSVQGFRLGCSGTDPVHHGNCEAGVVIDVPPIDERDLCGALGFDPTEEANKDDFRNASDETADAAGEVLRPVPPIIAAVWHERDRRLVLMWAPGARCPCTLLIGSSTLSIDAHEEAIVLPADAHPVGRLGVQTTDLLAWVPLFRPDGRFCHGPGERYAFDEALGRLLDFPSGGDEDDADGEQDGLTGSVGDPAGNDDLQEERRGYPIHRAMLLIESIASRNQTVPAEQQADWVAHLRRVLFEDLDPQAVASFRALGINVLEPLRAEDGFAPPQRSEAYDRLIADLMVEWGLAGMPGFRRSAPAAQA